MPDPSQLFNNLDGGGGNVGMPDPSQLFNNLDGGDSGGSAGGGGGGDLPDGVPTNPGAAFDILDGNDPNYEYGTGQQGSGDLPDGVPTNPEAAFDRLDSDADPNYQYGQSGQQGSQSDAFTPVGQGDSGSGAAVGQTGGGGSQSGGGSPSGGGSSGGGSPSGGGGSPPPPALDDKNKKLLKALKKILSKMGDKVDEAQIPAEMKGLFKDFAALKDLVDDD